MRYPPRKTHLPRETAALGGTAALSAKARAARPHTRMRYVGKHLEALACDRTVESVAGKGSKMGETSKHASSKHARKERRTAERTMARDGADRLAEAARKREASERRSKRNPTNDCPAADATLTGKKTFARRNCR